MITQNPIVQLMFKARNSETKEEEEGSLIRLGDFYVHIYRGRTKHGLTYICLFVLSIPS